MAADKPLSSNTALHPRWWALTDPEEIANEVVAISDGLETDDQSRRDRYLSNLRLYELRELSGLNAAGYATRSAPKDLLLPVVRTLCDTVQADIAGRQRPVPMFMTSGADWKTRRRAKKLGKFVEAILHQPQGTYVDGWELAVDVFLDACIYGTGVIHVYVDEKSQKVVLERIQPEEIHVDPREAECGEPLNYFRTYLYDADAIYHKFKDDLPEGVSDEQLKMALEAAMVEDPKLTVESYGSTRIGRAVKVREAIRLPLGDEDPGVHAIAISGLLLKREEWTRSEPYVFVRWSRERRGFWAVSLVDEVREVAEELNVNFERMQERMRLCANKRTVVSDDAGIDDASLAANEAENIFHCTGPASQAIYESMVPALNQADIDWHQIVEGSCFKYTGVSMTSATARKEPGVDSGVAIRTMQDLATKRFAVKARYAFEYPFVALARKIIDAVSEYSRRTKRNLTARLPQRRGLKDIRWSEVRQTLEQELDVQVAPISSLPSDPAGRLSTVNDLFMQQVISPQTYKRLLDWPDLEQETSRDNAEWEYVESVVEQFLDASEAEAEELAITPDGYLVRKEAALLQCTAAYFEARRDGAPEHNLKLLRDYMIALSKLIAPPLPEMPMTPGAPVGAGTVAPLATTPPPPLAPVGAPGAPGPITPPMAA